MKENTQDHLLYEELYSFIKREIGFKINQDTVFFKDLDLNGDDADEFMLNLKDQFDIDLTNFKLDEYFIDEYYIPFQYLFEKWFQKEKIKRKEFHLKHFIQILKKKKWIDVPAGASKPR